MRRPRLLRRSGLGLERLRPIVSASRRGPARRSGCLRYTQGHVFADVQSESGSRGASALRKRCPFNARAAAQLALVQTIDTALQGFVGFLVMLAQPTGIIFSLQLKPCCEDSRAG